MKQNINAFECYHNTIDLKFAVIRLDILNYDTNINFINLLFSYSFTPLINCPNIITNHSPAILINNILKNIYE